MISPNTCELWNCDKDNKGYMSGVEEIVHTDVCVFGA